MLGLIAFVVGALFGAFLARRRDGNRLDIAQYALVFGLIAFVLALLAAVVLARFAGV